MALYGLIISERGLKVQFLNIWNLWKSIHSDSNNFWDQSSFVSSAINLYISNIEVSLDFSRNRLNIDHSLDSRL